MATETLKGNRTKEGKTMEKVVIACALVLILMPCILALALVAHWAW